LKAAFAPMLVIGLVSSLLGQAPAALPLSPPLDPPPQPGRAASWTKLVPNVASDQKQIWTFPRRLRQRKLWIPTAAVLGITGALVALDPKTGSYFRNSSSFDGFNNVFSSRATDTANVITPLSLYAAGLVLRNPKLRSTGMLAAQALADVEILTIAMKDVDRRWRPADVMRNGDYSDTWFRDTNRYFRGNGSFPSGHTIAAFSIATVVARRYGHQHRWIPYAAYGGAALVGFSRMSLSSHFGSDVFLGGALGYSISRFVVLRE
jgi:membrane-associated phospholipid phosphatase